MTNVKLSMGEHGNALADPLPPDPNAQGKSRRKLAESLVCYVSADDMELDHKEFLEMVRDRIEQDLLAGDW